jgi:hypothetical protein
MSDLKPGTICVIVAGCPENIGLIVEVVSYLGCVPPRENAYKIRTLSGRNFPQLWGLGKQLIPGYSNWSITDRHKLRPLIDTKDDAEETGREVLHEDQKELEYADRRPL